jgi:hypothetical protein
VATVYNRFGAATWGVRRLALPSFLSRSDTQEEKKIPSSLDARGDERTTMPKRFAIDGIERTKIGTYLRWVDEKGLQHSTECSLMLEYTKDGRYGLAQGDAETIKAALECS